MADFNLVIDKTLQSEGWDKITDDPNDPGGLTKFGISKRSYPNEDIRNLTIERAKEIYARDFWNKINGDNINSQAIADSIFDFAVNAGVVTSASLAQMVVGSAVDGVIGQNTIDAINKFDEDHFLTAFTVAKIARYVAIVKRRPDSRKYFFGWVCRTIES